MAGHRRLLLQSGIICAILILLAAAAYALSAVRAPRADLPAPDITTSFTYAPANIQFDPVGGWVLATGTVSLPKDIDGLRFAFVKRGTPCVFAYARMTSSAREAYIQSSFAERIFSGPNDVNQFDSSWYIRKADAPEGFAFDWNARQRYENEVRIIPPGYMGRWEYGDHFRAFLLFDIDGTTVPDACNEDVNAMLRTMIEYYPVATMDQSTVGALYVKGAKVLLLGNDDIARLVYQLPGSASDHTVAGNFLYYRVADVLHRLDMFTLQDTLITVPPLFIDANRSFIVSQGSIFSISEGGCAPDVPCEQKLYDTNIMSGKTAFLGDVHANSIMGYSTSDQAVYAEWAWGDAGCMSASVSRYSIIRGAVEDVGNFGSCSADADHVEQTAAYKAVRDRIDSASESVTHVVVSNGRLTAPSDNSFADAGAFPLFLAQ